MLLPNEAPKLAAKVGLTLCHLCVSHMGGTFYQASAGAKKQCSMLLIKSVDLKLAFALNSHDLQRFQGQAIFGESPVRRQEGSNELRA